MLIPCPHCGLRPSEEFVPKGLAEASRPALGGRAKPDGPAWQNFLHLRDNVADHSHEYFHHALGCRSWIVVHRHTLTHEVTGATMAADFWKADKPAKNAKDAKSPAAETAEDGQ